MAGGVSCGGRGVGAVSLHVVCGGGVSCWQELLQWCAQLFRKGKNTVVDQLFGVFKQVIRGCSQHAGRDDGS